MTPESPTPRTDAVTQRIGRFETAGGYHNEEVVVSANFARTPERDLAAERAARVKAEERTALTAEMSQQVQQFRARADAAEQDVKRLDWLEKYLSDYSHNLAQPTSKDPSWEFGFNAGMCYQIDGHGDTLRSAIDAALHPTPAQKPNT